jgi:hypothetical protein
MMIQDTFNLEFDWNVVHENLSCRNYVRTLELYGPSYVINCIELFIIIELILIKYWMNFDHIY